VPTITSNLKITVLSRGIVQMPLFVSGD